MSSLVRPLTSPRLTLGSLSSSVTMRGGNCGGLRSASLHSGPSQRFLRGLRPLVSVGPHPQPVSGGGHAPAIPHPSPQTRKKDSMYHPEKSLALIAILNGSLPHHVILNGSLPHHVILNEVKDLLHSADTKIVAQCRHKGQVKDVALRST